MTFDKFESLRRSLKEQDMYVDDCVYCGHPLSNDDERYGLCPHEKGCGNEIPWRRSRD